MVRLAVWNCNMRFHDKLDALPRIAPDVLVVPECACPEVLLRRAPGLRPTGFAWTGRHARQGLAILTFGPWRVAADTTHGDRNPTTIAARIGGPATFRLVAAWAAPGGREPLGRAFDRLEGFLTGGPAAIAGDFNRDLAPRRPLARRLAALGFDSAYHRAHGVGSGGEAEPTLSLRRREGIRGHRDVILLDRTLLAGLRGVTVGAPATWRGASDHVPVIAEIETRPLLT